jgi:5-hydroxyisourate hydrolase-like protein (transthyretin family)
MSHIKRMMIFACIGLFAISCKKQPNPDFTPGDTDNTPPKVYVQFIDFISNEPVNNLELSLWRDSNNNIFKSASLFTDYNGYCQLSESRTVRFIIPETTTYLQTKNYISSAGLTDNNALLLNSLGLEFIEKKGKDNYYRVKLLKKANTIIHLQQVNKYQTVNSVALLSLSPFFYYQNRNSFIFYSSLDNTKPPLAGEIVLNDSAMLDIKINLSLAADIENMISWNVHTYPSGTDYDFPPDPIVIKKGSVRNVYFSTTGSNEILIQF